MKRRDSIMVVATRIPYNTGMNEITDRLSIVIVTYKRQELLSQLIESLINLSVAPWRVVIVDNENSERTQLLATELEKSLIDKWGMPHKDTADAAGNLDRVVYVPMEENLGGSGGFSMGVKRAWELGSQWFWVMDDDVEVLPDAIEKLSQWMPRFDVIQGSRLDYDGGAFYWQYNFIVPLGIPNPIAPAKLGERGYKYMNTLCFEGGLFHRRIVNKIGIPDSRFFIYWDDSIYGYCASKVTKPVVVSDVILKRTRNIDNWNIAGLRQLNSTSDMNRYYIMRNRGHMARYFMVNGDYHPFLFSLGTCATFIKELIRIIAVDRHSIITGVKNLLRGWRDSHAIFHASDWQMMPHPLDE